MKRAIALTLLTLIILSSFLLIPAASQSTNPADSCWNNWERCKARALASDMGVIKTTLALTLCDIALGNCLMKAV
ncbi:MAG: hypothetical protein ACPLZD_05305 [Candidatus Saccharicenans sp.]|nr:MAG: hypothetical protein C0168_10615 [Candidatus Aminicenantes bacterium]HEK85976.1 hypothetical protein [Candidatus Aminicenantes bacterium]